MKNPTDQQNLQSTLPTPSGSEARAFAFESMPSVMPYNDFCTHIQSLNPEQYNVLQVVLDWCMAYVQSSSCTHLPKPSPVHLFVTGGAGTGKSHLITAVYQTIQLMLQREGGNPDCPKVLLLAPTGTAAYNIEGVTIHAGLLLSVKKSQSRKTSQLSDDKRNTLRAKLFDLKFIIIDEISMVGCDFLLEIHNRLTEIFGTYEAFGGLSVIAVGDMYQLPPVFQKFIFETPTDIMAALAQPLWPKFSFMELTEIMRQADDKSFSELLNRLRVGQHTAEDVRILQSRSVKEDDPLLDSMPHVYVTRAKVNDYNVQKLNNLQGEKTVLSAVDRKPSSLKNFCLADDEKYTGGLPKDITIAIGARVMLLRNVDVSDGLVNGSQGTVVDIIFTRNTPIAVMVSFDSAKVGRNARINTKFDLSKYADTVVPITPMEVTFSPTTSSTARVTRTQFPLRLSWAVTIHKIQGATLNNIVVSFENHFNPGQAYVACSRVKKLSDLHITHFDEKKIISSKVVKKEMTRLQYQCCLPRPFCVENNPELLTMALLNARSARLHHNDIMAHPVLRAVDILCLTEAHIYENQLEGYQRDGWTMTALPMSREDNCHGLVVYSSHRWPQDISMSHDPHLEKVVLTTSDSQSPRSICLLYRSPSSDPAPFV